MGKHKFFRHRIVNMFIFSRILCPRRSRLQPSIIPMSKQKYETDVKSGKGIEDMGREIDKFGKEAAPHLCYRSRARPRGAHLQPCRRISLAGSVFPSSLMHGLKLLQERYKYDADEILKEMHHDGGNQALPPQVNESQTSSHSAYSNYTGCSFIAVPE